MKKLKILLSILLVTLFINQLYCDEVEMLLKDALKLYNNNNFSLAIEKINIAKQKIETKINKHDNTSNIVKISSVNQLIALKKKYNNKLIEMELHLLIIYSQGARASFCDNNGNCINVIYSENLSEKIANIKKDISYKITGIARIKEITDEVYIEIINIKRKN